MATSPTQRTLKYLRKLGYVAAIVEKWNPHARVRQDLFGFGDVLAIREGEILIVQATSGSNMASRVKKMNSNPNLGVWLASGGLAECWGWRKIKRGSRRLWEPNRRVAGDVETERSTMEEE